MTTFDDRSPIYRQIADQIKADVLSGALQEGDQVMSTNEYATFYRINPATAAKAFHELVDAGILYRRRGVGMFVEEDARAKLQAEHQARFFPEVFEPMVEQARVLGIPLQELIERLEQLADEDKR